MVNTGNGLMPTPPVTVETEMGYSSKGHISFVGGLRWGLPLGHDGGQRAAGISEMSQCLCCAFLASPLLLSITIVRKHTHTHDARAPCQHQRFPHRLCGWLLGRNVISLT